MNTNTNKTTNTNTPKLSQFTQPTILKRIGHPRLVRFFSPFDANLKAADIAWPQYRAGDDEFFVVLAQLLALPGFPTEPLQALARLERLATPENTDSLNSAFIRHHLHDTCIPTTSPALDKALELWFCSPQIILELTDPLMPSEIPIGDQIKIQNSKIKNEILISDSATIENPSIVSNSLSTSTSDSCNSCELVLAAPKSDETKLVAPNSSEQPAAASPPIENPKSLPREMAVLSDSSPSAAYLTGGSPRETASTPACLTGGSPREIVSGPPTYLTGAKIENPELLPDSNLTDSQFSSPIQALPREMLAPCDAKLSHPGAEPISLGSPALDPRPSALDSSGSVSLPALDARHSTLDSATATAGAQLLHQVLDRYCAYLILPPGAAVALTLWTAHAHCFTAFRLTPRLNLQSPEPGCGKTTTLDVIASLVPRPVRTENLTAPILFRLVDQSQPTLLLDEVDAYLPQAEELRGLLNAGHKRGACAYRCGQGKSNLLRSFKAFAPAVLSGLGKLPGTLHDRSIHIPLIQAEPGQIKAWFDESHADLEAALNQKLAAWTTENFEAIRDLSELQTMAVEIYRALTISRAVRQTVEQEADATHRSG